MFLGLHSEFEAQGAISVHFCFDYLHCSNACLVAIASAAPFGSRPGRDRGSKVLVLRLRHLMASGPTAVAWIWFCRRVKSFMLPEVFVCGGECRDFSAPKSS